MNLDEFLFRYLTGRTERDEERRRDVGAAQGSQEREHILTKILSAAAEADAADAAATPPGVDELLALGARRAGESQGKPSARRSFFRMPRPWERLGWAAALLAGIGLSLLWRGGSTESEFAVREVATAANETVTIVLGEGTVVRLAPRSRLRLNGNGNEREVALSGKGYFAVVGNEADPFRVRTPHGEVRVIGTRFEVDSETEDLRVVVVEGTLVVAVEEAEQRVEAGQMTRVVRGRPLPPQALEDPVGMINWLGNFLAFQETPLSEAAREIERLYGVQVEIQDAVLAQRTVTSHFADWSLPDLVDALCLIVHASCSLEDGVVTMASL